MTPAVIVHHITPITQQNIDNPAITLNPDNLMAVCKPCHEEIHGEIGEGVLNGREQLPQRVGFDEYGNVVRLS